MKYLLIFFIALLIVISGCIQDIASKKTTECIASKSILYFSESCIHCIKQEKMFGENFQYLNVIDCKKEPEKCIQADIIGTPTWVINGEKLVGVQDIETLIRVTNCAWSNSY